MLGGMCLHSMSFSSHRICEGGHVNLLATWWLESQRHYGAQQIGLPGFESIYIRRTLLSDSHENQDLQ
jgi:hypothetical protein